MNEKIRIRSHKGFTLLEVIVALAIVSVALGTLLSAANNSVRLSSKIQLRIIAQWVAENKASELRLNKNRLSSGVQSNEITMLNRKWLIKTVISSTPDKQVKQINVNVFLANKPKLSISSLISYVAN